MPLTDIAIKAARPQARPYKLADGEGLHLLVTPAGGKLGRLAYRFGGLQKRLAFGSYRHVSLAEARERRTQAKRLLASGIDPGAVQKAEWLLRIIAAPRAAFETAGVLFIEQNGNGPGVRLKDRR